MNELQKQLFEKLDQLYRYWNEQINVISRMDKVLTLQPGAKVMDLGCGGCFPGIPLDFVFTETEFLLVDSITQKVKVCGEVA